MQKLEQKKKRVTEIRPPWRLLETAGDRRRRPSCVSAAGTAPQALRGRRQARPSCVDAAGQFAHKFTHNFAHNFAQKKQKKNKKKSAARGAAGAGGGAGGAAGAGGATGSGAKPENEITPRTAPDYSKRTRTRNDPTNHSPTNHNRLFPRETK